MACRNHGPLFTAPSAMCASRCSRCGWAPADNSPDRRASRSLVPSPTSGRGRTLPHLRGRCCQCLFDSKSEIAGELRGTGASKGAAARTPPRIPRCLCMASPALLAHAGRGRAVSVRARVATPSARPCGRSDPNSNYVEQNLPNVLRNKGFTANST